VEFRFLLDTNICIYVHKKRPEAVLDRFLDLAPGEAAISIITYGELLYGASKSVHRTTALERIREFVRILPALSLPESAAEIYAATRAELESKGQVIGTHDLWIAAHALASDLILVTSNEKEFRRVRGLKIQNWAA
jgi:tRNA(fMet)-specific endonuclease VapC